MLSKVLQDKLDNWNLEKEEIRKEISDLETAKRAPLLAAVQTALRKRSAEDVIKARQIEAKHQEKIDALKSILQDVESTYPIDRELFRKEQEAFLQHHRDIIGGKYAKIVEQIKELDRLFTDYDNTYEAYVQEFAAWIPVGNTVGSSNTVASAEILDYTQEFEKFKRQLSYTMDDIKISEMRADESNR